MISSFPLIKPYGKVARFTNCNRNSEGFLPFKLSSAVGIYRITLQNFILIFNNEIREILCRVYSVNMTVVVCVNGCVKCLYK